MMPARLMKKIHEVALSDDRRPNQPIDNTVDLQTASYTNSIGATHFNRIWTDPDFDPSLSAFYYVRVLEIPTPRWTAYDEVKFKVAMPDIVPKIIQDRAYTSAIWYTP